MPKCTYCGQVYEFPRGLTLVMKDGTVKHLCSPKCKKNMAMKRRKVEWIRKANKPELEEKKA
jgi:large subunit ribosomal protein L24e